MKGVFSNGYSGRFIPRPDQFNFQFQPDPELRLNGAAGTPAEVVEKIEQYRSAGISRIYLQVLDLSDLDHLALVADEVAPHLNPA